MKIAPMDIQQKQFHLRFRGFDIREVDAFLAEVAEEVEALIREQMALKEDLHHKEMDLQRLREAETTLKNTLLTTQLVIEEMKNNAKKEAELIIREAEDRAEAAMGEAHRRLAQVSEEIVSLKREKRIFMEKLRGLIEMHLRLLELDDQEEAQERAKTDLRMVPHREIPKG
ncbi:MAG: DivIVA domain-containing protein [Nitrospirae bacterium]|nr:DivIVA domain-containing protein [Nitrospirota bacterium]